MCRRPPSSSGTRGHYRGHPHFSPPYHDQPTREHDQGHPHFSPPCWTGDDGSAVFDLDGQAGSSSDPVEEIPSRRGDRAMARPAQVSADRGWGPSPASAGGPIGPWAFGPLNQEARRAGVASGCTAWCRPRGVRASSPPLICPPAVPLLGDRPLEYLDSEHDHAPCVIAVPACGSGRDPAYRSGGANCHGDLPDLRSRARRRRRGRILAGGG